jgi:hypothetical protein
MVYGGPRARRIVSATATIETGRAFERNKCSHGALQVAKPIA